MLKPMAAVGLLGENQLNKRTTKPSRQRSNDVYEDILMYTAGVISHCQVDLRQMFSCFISPSSTYTYTPGDYSVYDSLKIALD